MKAGFWKILLAAAILTLALAACAPAPSGGGTGSNGAAPTTAAGSGAGDTGGTAAPTTAAGGDTGAAVCAGVDTQALISSGQALYTEKCAGCHGAQGEGQGNFPAFAGNADITAADVTGAVTKYFSVDAHPKDVTAEQLAGLLSYVRGSFGNTATAVCPTDITIPATQ